MREKVRAFSIVEHSDGSFTVVLSDKAKQQVLRDHMSMIDAVNFVSLLLGAGLVDFDVTELVELDAVS